MTSTPATWQWSRQVSTWADAELMAAAHMRELGFADARVTAGGADSGLDVVAQRAAAQVKFHTAPTGSPDIQRLLGAAHSFEWRLFYATAFTSAAFDVAEAAGMALFLFDGDSAIVAPANGHATVLAPPQPVVLERTAWGRLTLSARQQRALGWAGQVSDATSAPISNRNRKAQRQLEDRAEAMRLVVSALELLDASNSSLAKTSRRERAVRDAEDSLHRASKLLGLRLR